MNMRSLLGRLTKVYLVIGALAASAFANADMSGCAPACCEPVCNAPPQCGWGYNPPAYPKCGNGSNNFFDTLGLRVDYLYWRPSVDQLALGTEESITPITSTTGTPVGGTTVAVDKSYVKRPDFGFESGFRLGFNHFCPCDCWDVALNWTHYHNKSSVSGSSDNLVLSGSGPYDVPTTPYTVFVPYWERAVDVFPDKAEGHWTFDVDFIDLEFGHKYFVSSCFVLRPHLGLRGARVNQGFHVESSADRAAYGDETGAGYFGVSSQYASYVDAKDDFLAIGPRIGVGLELDIGCGFSIVGEAAGSIVFGRAKKHSFENFVGALDDTGTSPVSAPTAPFQYEANGSRSGSSRLISDLSFGVKWDHCINWCNQYHPLTVAILWEHHGFYGFNQFEFDSNAYTLVTTSGASPFAGGTPNRQPNGDIFTQGLTVAFNIGF